MDEIIRDAEGFRVLVPKCGILHKKINYLVQDDLVLDRIYEYDIRSANTSMLRASQKMKPETLAMIDELPKHDREVYIGKMIVKDPSIRVVIADGILKAKQLLFIRNGIQDDEVLSIKNDAVYIIGRRLQITKVIEGVEFKEKNVYSMYMRIDKMEFYYDRRHKRVDVKGLRDDVVNHPDHAKGIINFFVTVMEHLIMDRRNALRKYLISFVQDYKAKKLPIEYYREFNRENIYRTTLNVNDWTMNLTAVDESDYDIINGIYNYMQFILPIVQRFL